MCIAFDVELSRVEYYRFVEHIKIDCTVDYLKTWTKCNRRILIKEGQYAQPEQ